MTVCGGVNAKALRRINATLSTKFTTYDAARLELTATEIANVISGGAA
jgi:hypothetical protein